MSAQTRSVWLVIIGIASVQLGASIAKSLFDEITPTTMVWLRLATSAVVLLAVVRPRLTGRSRADWLVALGFGAALATMNYSIYESFARIPLGMAVTLEFLGPLGLAIALSRRLLDLSWALLAGLGVVLLGWQGGSLDPVGVGFALVAGAAWAAYIVLSAATGRRWTGLDGLAVATGVGTAALAPFAIALGGAALLDPRILLIGAVVGILSSVIPYSLELVALRTLPARTFGVLMSLEPAAAALAGLVVLSERLTAVQSGALVCVVCASIGVTRTARNNLTEHSAPQPAAT